MGWAAHHSLLAFWPGAKWHLHWLLVSMPCILRLVKELLTLSAASCAIQETAECVAAAIRAPRLKRLIPGTSGEPQGGESAKFNLPDGPQTSQRCADRGR